MEDLSPRQTDILEFILGAIDQSGVAPSYREIGAALGIGSTNGVSDHIKALIRKGYLERVGSRGTSRSLRPTERATGTFVQEGVVGVPILGRIAAGAPLLAQENYEGTMRLDTSLLPNGGNVFALVVTGDSMIEDGIHEGDLLLVKQQANARSGEIAVVMVDGDATVKRFFPEGDRIRLQPANSAMDPIYVDRQSGDTQIVGVAVGVFRQL
ncbi:MAG: transcriptional repressor LexA [Proteobacteria bacterium]|nr:transcriptional repressor LexA [Pseudomonadota bacterium]